MISKKTLAIAIAIAVVFATIGGTIIGQHFRQSKASGGDGTTTEATTESTTQNASATSGSAVTAEEPTDEEIAEAKEDVNNLTASGTEATGEEDTTYFSLPTKFKEIYTSDVFSLTENDKDLETLAELFPERTINWHSYSKFIQQRKATGMTDACSIGVKKNIPIEKLSPAAQQLVKEGKFKSEAQKQTFIDFLYWFSDEINNPALMVAWADFFANYVIFDDGARFGNVVPALDQFIEDDNKAIENSNKWRKLMSKRSFASQSTAQKLEADMDELDGQCGIEHWCQGRKVGDEVIAERNKYYDRYVNVLFNVFLSFQVLDYRVINTEVNYYLPSSGDDMTVKIIENHEYQVYNTEILAFAKVSKNGTAYLIFGIDTRDGRPELKETKTAENARTGKSSGGGSKNPPSGGGGKNPPGDNGGGDKPGGGGGDKPGDGGGDNGGGTKDGKGEKDPGASAVANGNANDTGHTNEDVNSKGIPTEEQKTPTGEAATVYSGGSNSGARNDNDAGYNGTSTNGSSMSSDTSNGPANGSTTTDSSGVTTTVDNQLNETNDSVDTQATKQGDEGTAHAGWQLSPDED